MSKENKETVVAENEVLEEQSQNNEKQVNVLIEHQNFKNEIAGLVSSYIQKGIPAMILRPIVSDLINDLAVLESQQYQQALQQDQNQ